MKHIGSLPPLIWSLIIVIGAITDSPNWLPVFVVFFMLISVWLGMLWLNRKIVKLEEARLSNATHIADLTSQLEGLISERRWDSDSLRADLARNRMLVPRAQLPDVFHPKHRILLVDDDPQFCDIFRVNFRRYFIIHVANNLNDAHRILNEEGIECVLLDLKLPPLSGEEVMSQFRDRHPVAVAVVMSGYESQQLIAAAKKHKIEAYLSKDLVNDNPSYIVQAVRLAIFRHNTD